MAEDLTTIAGIAVGVSTTTAGIVAAIYRYKERRLQREEKAEELEAQREGQKLQREDQREDSEIRILLGHIAQLERLWQHSLTQIEQLRKDLDEARQENAALRAEVRELRHRLEDHDKTS